jgi:NADH-quinone oxidoreductase subunit N
LNLGFFGSQDYLAILPPLLMAIFGSASLLLQLIAPDDQKSRRPLVWFNLVSSLLVAASLLQQWRSSDWSGANAGAAVLQGAVRVDSLALFANTLVWVVTFGILLISYRYLELAREHAGEYYGLLFFAECGMYFMAAGADLITLIVGLELTAISFYILVGFTRTDRRSNEAAMKYLLLGALSSAFVLYGFSFLYGMSGTTSLAGIAEALARTDPQSPFFLLGMLATIVGLLFKVSAAPFHNWAPDAYDGAPTPVTGFLGTASTLASFAVLIRLLAVFGQDASKVWSPVLICAAILSLTVGSFAALTQDRLKRLFAYSGVAHAGYVLLGLAAASPLGNEAVYLYMLVYAFMNAGSFALLTSLRSHGVAGESIVDLRGLSRTNPMHAALFVILLLSLAGIPPTAGFVGKYLIFAALLQSGHPGLAIIGSIYAVVGAFFYFRLIREMYLERSDTGAAITASVGVRVALMASAVFTVVIGFFPDMAVRSAEQVARMIR